MAKAYDTGPQSARSVKKQDRKASPVKAKASPKSSSRMKNGNWDKVPHTDKRALPCRFREVWNKRVIWVEEGKHRNATLTGHFELEDQSGSTPFVVSNNEDKVHVLITWYNTPLKEASPLLIVTNRNCKIIDNYSGNVIDDVARSV